ncbi:hypothetical protein [Rhodopseudomonas palustris]|nr:hypothetical protein [Rhodopseudomonas palustris]
MADRTGFCKLCSDHSTFYQASREGGPGGAASNHVNRHTPDMAG